MKNKGFTLIELLAVIIILAIIALIAVPTIINLIEKSKDESLEVSAKGYVEGIDNCIASKMLLNEEISTDKVTELNSVCLEYLKGTLPTDGNVVIVNDSVVGYKLFFGEKLIEKEYIGPYAIGTPVFFNPVEGEICDTYVASNSLNENKTGCMKWYIIGERNNTVDMILDHNTTYKKTWASKDDYVLNGGDVSDYQDYGNNNLGPVTLLVQLHSDTDSWLGVTPRTDNYVDPARGFVINYNGYRARLIEANEIAKITGANEALQWDSAKPYDESFKIGTSVGNYYLDGKYGSDNRWKTAVATGQGTSHYAWLYDYTKQCTSYGCNVEDNSAWFGYWTSSATAGNSTRAYYVGNGGHASGSVSLGGRLSNSFVYYYGNFQPTAGLRPVITIPKF